MKIVSMKLKNFRSYRDEVEIKFDDLTAFVGENDIGKSTILEALDIFFNGKDGAVKLEREDTNVIAEETHDNEIVISVCFFVDQMPQIIIDATVPTTLEDEHMLNENGLLEIVKKYRNAGNPSVFIRASHPVHSTCQDCNNLLLKSSSELRNIINTYGVECEDQRINKVMRAAIWRHFSEELGFSEVEIDASQEDARKIWNSLSGYLPLYSLFQSDRKNSDGDSEVKDPLKLAVERIINSGESQELLGSAVNRVTSELNDVSRRTVEKLREMGYGEIANSLNPVIPTIDRLKWTDVFKAVSITGDEGISINKRGSGVKRIILFSFFKAEVDRRLEAGDNNGVIYAIEEPETSQHPSNQRKLITALKDIAAAPNTQVIITTHSPIIVKELDFAKVRMFSEDETGRHIEAATPKVLPYASLNEVIYLAYCEPTEEYHDELFAYLKIERLFGNYSRSSQHQKWYIRDDGRGEPGYICLSEYIRNQIHHPENRENERFTKEELKQSIDEMREYIQNYLERERAGNHLTGDDVTTD